MTTDLVSTQALPSQRAEEVRQKIEQIKTNMVSGALDLGELLSEVRAYNYYSSWGYESFGGWLGSSGLDMSERTAYYLIKIIDNSRALGIGRSELEQVKMSKLKEIFTLDPATSGQEIKALVAQGDNATLEEIKATVDKVKSGDENWERPVWLNFKLLESQKEVVKEAIERVKREAGSTVNDYGEVVDISDGAALELMAANYLASPDPILNEIETMEE